MLAGAIISTFSFPGYGWKERRKQDRARGISACGYKFRRSFGEGRYGFRRGEVLLRLGIEVMCGGWTCFEGLMLDTAETSWRVAEDEEWSHPARI